MFKTKVQIFSAIAWVISIVGIAYSAYCDFPSMNQTTNAEKIKEVTVTYLQMLAVTTGVCMLAWGIPFFPGLGARIVTGKHCNEPFSVGDGKIKKKKSE